MDLMLDIILGIITTRKHFKHDETSVVMEATPSTPENFRRAASRYLSRFPPQNRDKITDYEEVLLREAGISTINNAVKAFTTMTALTYLNVYGLSILYRLPRGFCGPVSLLLGIVVAKKDTDKSTDFFLAKFLSMQEENCGILTNTLRKEFFEMVPPTDEYRHHVENKLRDNGMANILEKLRFQKDDTFKVDIDRDVVESQKKKNETAAVQEVVDNSVPKDIDSIDQTTEDYQVRQRQARFKVVQNEEMKKMGKTSLEDNMSPEELEKLEIAIVERLAKEKNLLKMELDVNKEEYQNDVPTMTKESQDFFSIAGLLPSNKSVVDVVVDSSSTTKSDAKSFDNIESNVYNESEWESYSNKYRKPTKKTTWEEIRAKARQNKSAFHDLY